MHLKAEVLSEKDLLTVHENTLELLSKYGIKMKHEEAKRVFLEHGAKVEGDYVKMSSELVMKALSSVPYSFTLTGRNTERNVNIGAGYPPVFGPGAGAIFVSDYDRGRRAATVQDLRNLLALSQSSKYVNVACADMVYPSDIPEGVGIEAAILEAVKICDKPLIGLSQNSNVSEKCINHRLCCQ